MNSQLAPKLSILIVAYTDVVEGREQGSGSFINLPKAIAPARAPYLRPVGNSALLPAIHALIAGSLNHNLLRQNLIRSP